MPTRLNDIETTFHLRVSEALQGLDQIISKTAKAEKAFGSAERSLQQLGKGLSLFGAASTAAFGFAIKGALEEEQQLNQLRATIEGIGDSFEAQRPGIESFIDALTQATRFSDDELRPALNRAILATNSVEKGMEAAALGAKVAAAGFGSLEGNATLIARLFEGQVRAIGRLIPEYRDLEERLEAGANEAGLAAEALDRLRSVADRLRPPDSLNLLNKSLDELRDKAGKAAFEGLEPLIKKLTEGAIAAEKFVQTDFGRTAVQVSSIVGPIAAVVGGLLIFSGQVVKNARELGNLLNKIPGLTKALKFLVLALAGTGGLIPVLIIAAGAVAGLSVVLKKLSKDADEARDKAFTSDRLTQFRAEMEKLNEVIADFESGQISAKEAAEEFNKVGVRSFEEAKQRVEVLGRVTERLEAEAKAQGKVTEAAEEANLVTRESILATEKLAGARLQAALDRVGSASDLGLISGEDAAKQVAQIEAQRTALHIETLKKLLELEIEFGKRRVDAGLDTEREYANKVDAIRGDLQAAQILAATSGLDNEAAIIQARLDLQESSNKEFIELVRARQETDESVTKDRIALGQKSEADLTALLISHLAERTNFQRADIAQRLATLQAAGLEESKIAEDLNAQLIKIDLAAEAQRSALQTDFTLQRRSQLQRESEIDRELRRLLLVTGETDIQAARLAEIDLAFEAERAVWGEHLANLEITYDQYIEALKALDQQRSSDRKAILDADVALEQSLRDARRDAINAVATLSANFAVDFVSGVEGAGKAAAKFFKQLLRDLAFAIARALILRAIIGAAGGPTSFIGKLLGGGGPFQDPRADQLARFEGTRFADLFFQGMFREFNTSQDRMASALTQNREINRSNSSSMTAIVNEATPETTVEFTDRHVEPRVRQRANQRSSRGTLTNAERDRLIEDHSRRLDELGFA